MHVQFYDQNYRGQSTLFLKREIRQQFPGINLRRADLLRVRLIAKSRRGRGTAALKVGYDVTYPQTVSGNPYDFNDPAPYTFDRVPFDNPSWDSTGVWQIKLRGNFIVRKVVVIVELVGSSTGPGPFPNPGPGPYNPGYQWQYLTTFNPPTFSYQTITIPLSTVVKTLKIQSNRGNSKVTNVTITLRNGQQRRLSDLEGHFKDSDSKQANIRGNGFIRDVQITASSRAVFKPGEIEIHALMR